jgi:hypothetical protein
LTILNWTIVDSDGSLFSRGKHDYYAIIIRGIPEKHPKDCVIELYVTNKEMTIFEIKVLHRFRELIADNKYRSSC